MFPHILWVKPWNKPSSNPITCWSNPPMKVSNGEYPQSSSKSLDQVCSKTEEKPMVLGIPHFKKPIQLVGY